MSRLSLSIPLALFAGLCLATTVGCKKPTTAPTSAGGDAEVDADADAEEEEEEEEEEEVTEEEEAVLSKDSFEGTITDNMNDVLDCYMTVLEGNADLAGQLRARFTFGVDGSVAVEAVEGSTLDDEGLVTCVGEAAQGWGFDKPANDGVGLEYPFDLAPAE